MPPNSWSFRGPPKEGVVARFTKNHVATPTAALGIVSRSRTDSIAALKGSDHVIATQANYHIVAGRALKAIIAGGAYYGRRNAVASGAVRRNQAMDRAVPS